MNPTVPEPGASPARDPRISGPLDRDTALAYLSIADRLLAGGEFDTAAGYYQRVIGYDDPAITAAAILGFGNVLYRLDRDDEALGAWREVIRLGETPSAYQAWRQIAAALVRDGKLVDAVGAYREADRRAPPEDKAEIASRLGWLAKETGDPRGASRYFARSRGQTGLPIPLTYLIIGLTVIVSLAAETSDGRRHSPGPCARRIRGGPGRMVAAADRHAGPRWLPPPGPEHVCPVPGRSDRRADLRLEAVRADVRAVRAGRVGGQPGLRQPGVPSVGASGAIFGLFGVVLAATRIHDPILDRRSGMLVSRGTLIVINLVLGFGFNSVGGNIDIGAHIGGLIAGLWLGSSWSRATSGRSATCGSRRAGSQVGVAPESIDRRLLTLVRFLGVLALVTAIAVTVGIGIERDRSVRPSTISAVAGDVAAGVGRERAAGSLELALSPARVVASGAGSR